MKKCLFITTQFPYPLDNGGKIGAYNGLSVVSANYDVTVLSFCEEMQYVNEGINFFENKLPNVHFEKPIEHDIHIRKKPFKMLEVLLKGYLFAVPYVAEKFFDKKMLRLIDYEFNQNIFFDIVFIDYLNMGEYLRYIQRKYSGNYSKIIIKDHNKEFEIVKQAALNVSGLKRLVLDREWKLTEKYERKCIKDADIAFSVCYENTLFLKGINNQAYTMLPTFEMLPARHKKDTHNILYIGNLSWEANIGGLKWFVDEVMPIVLQNIPDAKLTVVGSGSNEFLFSGYKYVEYLGYVKDVSHIYDDKSVFIVPLFEGSGIRIKILEAFNHEIPVVSTSIGCDTIGAKNRKEILIADDKNNFAKNIEELLLNSKINAEVTYNAKMFLKTHYSLSSRQSEFLQIIDYRD